MRRFKQDDLQEDANGELGHLNDYLSGRFESNDQQWNVFGMEKLVADEKFLLVVWFDGAYLMALTDTVKSLFQSDSTGTTGGSGGNKRNLIVIGLVVISLVCSILLTIFGSSRSAGGWSARVRWRPRYYRSPTR